MLVLSSLTGLSLCLRLSKHRLRILNLLIWTKTHDITVVVESQGETVFETVQEVPPYDETQPVLTYDDGIPTDTARYTVRAEVDSGSDSIERTYPY